MSLKKTPDVLRQRAEQRLAQQPQAAADGQAVPNLARQLHELQVYQIELEIQNEELRVAQQQVAEELERYADFYDFSPTAFISLSSSGRINQINLIGASLLERTRSSLTGAQFERFISRADRAHLKAFLHQVFTRQHKQSCELELLGSKAQTLARSVQIDAVRSPDGQECRAVLVDITEHKVTQSKLLLAASVFTHTRESIIITDANIQIVDVNAAFSQATGYSRAEVLGHNPRMLQSNAQSPDFFVGMWRDILNVKEPNLRANVILTSARPHATRRP